MAKNELRALQVMLSSRVDDPHGTLGDGTKLREVRDRLTMDLRTTLFTDDPLFEVWVNEGSPALPGDRTIEQHCQDQVDQADVVLVLYNGRAGWASKGIQGICMTELQVARSRAPQKVVVIQLPLVETKDQIDLDFQEYFDSQTQWTSPEVSDYDGILREARRALRYVVAEMAHTQARQGGRRLGAMRGEALLWRHLDFQERAKRMRAAAAAAFLKQRDSRDEGSDGSARLVSLPYAGVRLLLRIDAVPAAMGVAAAREMVGQPFLRDHELADRLTGNFGGPVHVIACHGGITESQAIRLLGFPDATIVPADFGVYVADEVQKVQLILLKNCTSSADISLGVQMLLAWLEASDEDDLLAARGTARKKIVRLLAAERG